MVQVGGREDCVDNLHGKGDRSGAPKRCEHYRRMPDFQGMDSQGPQKRGFDGKLSFPEMRGIRNHFNLAYAKQAPIYDCYSFANQRRVQHHHYVQVSAFQTRLGYGLAQRTKSGERSHSD